MTAFASSIKSDTSLLLGGPTGDRNHMLDCARFVAALGVVWVHTIESPQFARWGVLGTFGVPFYVCVALFMIRRTLAKNPALPLPKYYLQRFTRLYIPFLFWTVIYLGAISFKHHFISNQPIKPLDVGILLGGSAYQLWFLPFLLLVTIPIAPLYRVTLAFPKIGSIVVLLTAALGTIWAFWPRPDWLNHVQDSDLFFFVAWKAGPSVFCGFAMAHFLSRMSKEALTMSGLAGIGFFLTLASLGNQVVLGYSRFDRTLSGLGWFLLTFAPLRSKIILVLGRFGRHSYGIYLSHALFVEGFQMMFHRKGWQVSPQLDLAVFALAIISSTLLTMFASRYTIPALLFGEPPRKTSPPRLNVTGRNVLLQVP